MWGPWKWKEVCTVLKVVINRGNIWITTLKTVGNAEKEISILKDIKLKKAVRYTPDNEVRQ